MPLAQQLGRYQLLDRIAFGGMAEIFRAKTFDHEGRAHLVAVKRVLNHLVADEDFMRMLVDEAKISAILQHDNIARVYEFAVDDRSGSDEYFIAMEYVDGKDVRTLLDRQRALGQPVPPEHVAYIGMEIAHALHAAHTKADDHGDSLQIVHRDVSPSNVLLSYRGEVKLCDFGIAKATTTRVQTKTGVIKGKVKYMSPEQAMGRKLDARSDLFSLGTVLYEMLTLSAPFVAATEVELIFAVRDARKRPAREIEPTVPAAFDELLDRLMARSRSERFQSGAELGEALRLFLEQYKPGYRRSHFGRFMRTLFETDIERELRLLEEYIIDGGDPEQVGENLLAEVLPADAPYTKFTAAHSGASQVRTGGASPDSYASFEKPSVSSAIPPARDLHSEETRILTRNLPSSALHAEKTQLLDRASLRAMAEAERAAQHDDRAPSPLISSEQTRLLQTEAAPLHELQTRILDRAQLGRAPTPPQPASSPPPAERPLRHTPSRAALVSLGDEPDTRVPTLQSEASTTERHPKIDPEDEEPTATVSESQRQRRDTVPSAIIEGPLLGDDDEQTAVPRGDEDEHARTPASRPRSSHDDGFGPRLGDDNESTTVPLGDDDLETDG